MGPLEASFLSGLQDVAPRGAGQSQYCISEAKLPFSDSSRAGGDSLAVRAVVQRVTSARVIVDTRLVGEIGQGLLVFVGVEKGDSAEDMSYIASKVRDLRIFEDDGDESGRERIENQSVVDIGGGVLVVSQFTLSGDVRRGRRPSSTTPLHRMKRSQPYEDVVRELRTAGAHRCHGRVPGDDARSARERRAGRRILFSSIAGGCSGIRGSRNRESGIRRF